MRIHTLENGSKVLEIVSPDFVLSTTEDALELISNTAFKEIYKVVIRDHSFPPEFFDLGSGLAGELLQKFANYHVQVAIVGERASRGSKNMQAFVNESNVGRSVFFVSTVEAALERLS